MPTVAPQRQYFFMVFVGLAASSLLWLWWLPVDSIMRVIAARAIALVATLVLVRRIVGMPAPVRVVWSMLWAYQALTLIADLVYADLQVLDAHVQVPNPSDVVYLATYGFAFAAVGGLTRLLHGRTDQRLLLEQRALIGAALAVLTLVLVGPWLLDVGGDALAPVIALAYPVLDLILVLTLYSAAHGRVRGNRSMQLLLGAFTAFLLLDAAYFLLALAGNPTEYRVLEVAWTAALLLISFAAHAPGAVPAAPSEATERESVSV